MQDSPLRTETVTFSGCRSGRYPATWAQLATHEALRQRGAAGVQLNVRMAQLLDGAHVGDVLGAIGRTLERHDALRTRCQVADGGLTQRVCAAGRLEVPVYPARADELRATVHQVTEALSLRPYSPTDPPTRMAIVTVDGTARAVAMSFSHLAVDGVAAGIVGEELRRLCGTGPPLPAPAAWQPGEIAAYETSEAGQAHARRADRYIRAELAASAPAPPPEPAEGGSGRLLEVAFDSRAVAAAALALARRHSVTEAVVLLAAHAVALSGRLGQDGCSVMMACANRGRRETAPSVANLSQFVPISVRTRGGSFADVVRSAQAASFRGYLSGHHDPRLFRASCEAAAAGLGRHIAIPHIVNIRTLGPRALHGDSVDPARRELLTHAGIGPDKLAALRADSLIQDLPDRPDHSPGGITFTTWGLSDIAQMTLEANEERFARDVLHQLFTTLEDVLVTAASDT